MAGLSVQERTGRKRANIYYDAMSQTDERSVVRQGSFDGQGGRLTLAGVGRSRQALTRSAMP